MNAWDALRAEGRGTRFDYQIEAKALDDTGGQAVVYRATHKALGLPVALKQLRAGEDTEDTIARMRREIDYGTTLQHRNITPVLDHGDEFTWFVMPLAAGSLLTLRQRTASEPARLLRLVRQVAQGLTVAHERNLLHRDVKPANVLRFRNDENRGWWAVADWGLGRDAASGTSSPGRTRTGLAYGTEGFAAPEMSIDAHRVDATADIYSLGQLIGWLLTGRDPIANVPNLPPAGPWLTVVREATRMRPADRPQSMQALLDLIDDELSEPEELVSVRARRILGEAGRVSGSLRSLIALAENNPDDTDLYLDVLPGLTEDQVHTAIQRSPDGVRAMLNAMQRHSGDDWRDRSFDQANTICSFIVRVCRAAHRAGSLEVFDAAVECYFDWDAAWDRWGAQNIMRPFLTTVRDDYARSVAQALRRHPGAKAHFESLATDARADARIRGAVTS